ncbi:RAD50-interacting protein 1 [Venturia canescens]|uniref:RAD50-interacting protein 1 n=1 Tax=Venturia canescens TaxID=32260 RepID=UPI001C9CF5A4|nr:RAD50-interacting protein 1 [Venturia canescens]
MSDIRQKVIDKFNAEFGSDLKNLDNIRQFNKQLEIEKNAIEASLSMASTEAPSKVKAALAYVDRIISEIDPLIEEGTKLSETIDNCLKEDNRLRQVQEIAERITELEKSLSYLRFIKCIENISNELEMFILADDDESAITMYTNLADISCQLHSSSCHHLSNYVRDTLHFWHNHLKEKLSEEYKEVLKTLKWPFCGSNASGLTTPMPDSMSRFKMLTEYLLQLHLPEETTTITVTSSLLTDFAPVCLPITLLVRPLRQRFIYHFTGSKQTNRRDKPEWFFTQILTWIKHHEQWVLKNVQPVVDAAGFNHINAQVEFMRALVQLAVEKLHAELPVVQYDDTLFAHLVDEALGFERELRDTLFYPASQPATVFVLTQAQIFVKWINMEKKYATEKMDSILSSESAWERLAGPDSDDMKVTECADAFLTLLMTISDRYNHLPQPGHRLQFLELQLELIDDCRVRLLQLLHEEYEDPLASLMPRILNTIHYISSVLIDWGVTVHFLQLHFFKKQFEAVETATDRGTDSISGKEADEDEGSVFDEAVALLQRLEKELVDEIVNTVALDVKAKSRPYRTDKWFAMQSEKEVASLSVTPSGCPMFEELATRLHDLRDALALPIFNKAWRNLAGQLDQYLLEEVVLVNQFNTGGAAQLQFDIIRNLFSLFGLYTSKPEAYFPLMREACALLNVLRGTAMLLLQTLEESNNAERANEVLVEIGVHKMSPEVAATILRTRTDMGM